MNWKDFEVEKINESIYVIRGTESCNIGVCVKNNAALMIDSGYFPKTSAVLKRMVERNLDCRVELLFNTHYHADHTFGNQSFDCPIIASEICRRNMERMPSSYWSPEETEKAKKDDPRLAEEWKDLKFTPPTTTFDDVKSIDFEGLNVIFQKFGGHTPDSSIAYFPDYRIVFAGDLVFAGRYPTLLDHDGDPVELVEALHKLIEMDVEIIIPGHGITCGKSSISQLIVYWTCLTSECRELVASGMDDERIKKEMLNRCHLPELPFDRMRHERNANSVLSFIKDHLT